MSLLWNQDREQQTALRKNSGGSERVTRWFCVGGKESHGGDILRGLAEDVFWKRKMLLLEWMGEILDAGQNRGKIVRMEEGVT